MKSFLLSFLFCFIVLTLDAQFVISEIMYNPPESGADSLEYIEIANTTSTTQNIEGYGFLEGVEYTFPEIDIPGGESVVICNDSAAMMAVLGISALQWTDGALRNGGEIITLISPDSVVRDQVEFSDDAPWPTFNDGTDGAGASIERCDLLADGNDPLNWRAADNDTGADINGEDILGTPGAENTVVCEDVSEFPLYPIGVVTTIDDQGIIDSIGVECRVRGVVHTPNLRPGGLTFVIIDENGDGLNVFSGNDDFGYTVQEGDEVEIDGEMGHFRGLAQISPVAIRLLSQDNPLDDPIVLTGDEALSEETESQLVTLTAVTLTDPENWLGDGSSFNVDFSNGTTTYQVRIDRDIDLASMPAPTGLLNVTGVGGQFDQDEPLLEGYQLFPRYAEDIEMIISTSEEKRTADVRLAPNPTQNFIQINSEAQAIKELRVHNTYGKEIMRIATDGFSAELSLVGMPTGLYMLRIALDDGSVAVKKVIKQ